MRILKERVIAQSLVTALAAVAWSQNILPAPVLFQAVVDADEPLLYYQFNEVAGNVINHGSLGDGYDAVINGTPVRAVPTAGGDSGIAFNSADDFLQSVTSSPVALSGNPTFSAETIVFVPIGGTAGLWAPFLHWGDSSPNPTAKSVYFSFSNNAPNEFYAGFYNGGLQAPAAAAPVGTWHHVLWIRTGGGTDQQGTRLFIDGVDVTSQLVADPDLCCNGSTPVVTSTEFRVNRARDFDGIRFFTGTMDELALYGRALTTEEAHAHFSAFNDVFEDGFENQETAGSPE